MPAWEKSVRIKSILLDMDGVVADWHLSCAKSHGVNLDELKRTFKERPFSIKKALGMDTARLWEPISAAGPSWWAEIPETPWARRLWNGCRSIAPTYFLTMPSVHPPNVGDSMAGKFMWLQKFTGNEAFNAYLMGPPKMLCANRHSVLIDDSDDNVKAWRKEGGNAILLPNCGNSMSGYKGCPCDFVLNSLREMS
jgi:hypothetical protein